MIVSYEFTGKVAAVREVPLGDETTEDLLTGETVIPVADSGDFYDDGGSVRILDEIYTYSELDEGDESGVPSITLDAPGLLGDVDAETPVEVWNPNATAAGGAVVADYEVDVADDIDGGSGTATLQHSLIAFSDSGIPPAVGDSVLVRVDDGGDWTVVDYRGKKPGIDPAYFKTGTLDVETVITVGDPAGKRVVIDGSPAIEAYDAANEQTVNIDGDENFMRGTIATDAPGNPRVVVGRGESFALPAEEVRFETAHADEIEPAEITVFVEESPAGPSDGDLATIAIRAPEWDDGVATPPALLLSTGSTGGSQVGVAQLFAEQVTLVATGGLVIVASPAVLNAVMGDGTVGTGPFRDSVRTAIGPTWTSYAGTITTANVTVGNGTLAADYLQNGKLVHFRIKLTFGSTTALTGSPTFTLPASATANRTVVGGALMFDSSAAIGSAYKGGWVFNNTINVLQVRDPTSAPLSATVPFTWATGDELVLEAYYEAA